MALAVAGCTVAPTASTIAPSSVVVTSVADGDTFRAMQAGNEIEVRILGINAPELDECHGDVAGDRLAELLGEGQVIVTATDIDQFGRTLAEVDAGSTDVALTMVQEGHAIATTGARPEVLRAEEEAAGDGLGLWSPQACGSAERPAEIRLGPIEPDPAGPDEEGETVLIVSEATSPIDLSGFVLRDESSVNRYHFRDGTALGPGASLTVATGCSQDTQEVVYWCIDQPVWNNDGDMAMLLDGYGGVVAFARY